MTNKSNTIKLSQDKTVEKQTVITEKELKKRWLNAEAHLRYDEHICKHGVVNAGDMFCKVCLKESMI